MPHALSLRKIFLLVAGLHLVVLTAGLLLISERRPHIYSSPIATVDLIQVKESGPAPQAEKLLPPEPSAREIREPWEAPAKPKKITRKVQDLSVPLSDLKKRLEQRLARIETRNTAAMELIRTTGMGLPGVTSNGAQKFVLNWYEDIIARKMYDLWKQPSKSTVGRDLATALVSFRVYRDGHIESIRFKRPSGIAILDRTVLEAVKNADPLPPLPQGVKGSFQEVNILFELKK